MPSLSPHYPFPSSLHSPLSPFLHSSDFAPELSSFWREICFVCFEMIIDTHGGRLFVECGLGKPWFPSWSAFLVFLNKSIPILLHPVSCLQKPPSGTNSASLTNMCPLFRNRLKIVLKQIRQKYFDVFCVLHGESTVWSGSSVNFHTRKSRCPFPVCVHRVFYSRVISDSKHNIAIVLVRKAPLFIPAGSRTEFRLQVPEVKRSVEFYWHTTVLIYFKKISFSWRKTELPYEAVLMIDTTNQTNGVAFSSKWWGGLVSPSTSVHLRVGHSILTLR